MKREIRSAGAPAPIGPYSQAIEASGMLFCSGQLGADPATGKLEEGITAQTRRSLANLELVMKAAGLGLKDVLKTSVFMTDLTQFQEMNDEYSKHFRTPFPARAVVQVAALPKGAIVEIDAIASRK